MSDEWAEDEVTERYVPSRVVPNGARADGLVESLFVLEQRVAALERQSLRIFEYLRRVVALDVVGRRHASRAARKIG